MAFSESLEAFFVLKANGGLADPATYDGSVAVAVLFDNEYFGALGMAGTQPEALGMASVFPENAVNKTLLINGVTYTIHRREPMDDGVVVRLKLRR